MPQQQWQRAFLMGAHSETPLKTINSTGQRIITDELPKQNKYCVYNPEDNFFLFLYYHSKNINKGVHYIITATPLRILSPESLS